MNKKYTNKFKKEFISGYNENISLSEYARKKGINRSTAENWIRNKEKILKEEPEKDPEPEPEPDPEPVGNIINDIIAEPEEEPEEDPEKKPDLDPEPKKKKKLKINSNVIFIILGGVGLIGVSIFVFNKFNKGKNSDPEPVKEEPLTLYNFKR